MLLAIERLAIIAVATPCDNSPALICSMVLTSVREKASRFWCKRVEQAEMDLWKTTPGR